LSQETIGDLTFQSDVGRIRRVLMKHVRDAFGSQSRVDARWQQLHYTARPDVDRAVAEYDALLGQLREFGMKVELLPEGDSELLDLDALYARDASIVTDRGVILCSMGKDARRAEPTAQRATYERLGIPILGEIVGEGRLEGGDVCWLDRSTLAVAWGYRTNAEGIRQLSTLLGDDIEVVVNHSPHFQGPDDVFHLMSVISPLADDLALIYSPLMSVSFREELIRRGFSLVEVPADEFDSLGCNVLALAPRVCLIPAGNLLTVSRLRAAGVEVHEFSGAEICLKGCGGPTCLTRPLEREA
jgi:N-dimethylarginine dimethylaminohydrolase